jgi:NADPH:quinone reductase-like Zn-dependent oxidoreductase
MRVGERVLVDPVLRGDGGALQGARYLGADRDGAFAEYVAVPASNAHAIHSPLSDVELAALPCSGSAAANMVARSGVRAGETVLVTGASGGVGSIAVQLCRLRGARVIAVAGSDKAQDVVALGAERTLAREADLVSTLGRDAVDVVIDVVGGSAFAASLDVLRPGGRYAVAGAIAGPRVELDLRTVYLKDLTLYGCTVTPPSVFVELVKHAGSGALRPRVSARYPLAEVAAAQSAFLEKRHTGKIVLLP